MSEKHEQVAAQCKVVAHLATSIAQVHSDKAELMAANAMPTIVDIVGSSTAHYMETLGDILNGMDAVTEDDDWTGPVFEEAQRIFPQPEEVTISRAQYEAYRAALEAAVLLEKAENRYHNDCEECEGEGEPEACGECFPFFDDARVKRREALEKARMAGIQTEGGENG